MAPRFHKTRIAPTPSGFLHLGNAYSFLLTQKLAAQTGAQLLLRIDDMDRTRVRQEYLQDIFDTLDFLGITVDEGPTSVDDFEARFSQIHRMPLYEKALKDLAATGKVYACDCSRTKVENEFGGIYTGHCKSRHLHLDMPDVAWRVDTGDASVIKVNRYRQPSIETTLPYEMQHFVIRKKDGFPAYQLTSLVDDLHFGVDLIVRGADLWHSTLAQLYLATLLDADAFLQTTFHHHALLELEGRKLSKSVGDTSINTLRNAGKDRNEIIDSIRAMSRDTSF